MKRNLAAAAILLAVSAAAFQPPKRTPLPNFDRRADNAMAPADALAPERTVAVEKLKTRAPQQVTTSKLLKAPSFFSSPSGFLTGPNAQGVAVSAATASAIPESDPHRAIKAFLNEHAAAIGYSADALNEASLTKNYVDDHNGLRTAVWQQEVNGVPVLDAITKGHITRNGELVNLYTHFVPDGNGAATRGMKGRTAVQAVSAPGISAEQAIVIGARNLGDEITVNSLTSQGPAEGLKRKQTFRGSGGVKGDQYAELTWLPLDANSLRLSWQVIVTSGLRSEMFLLVVDSETSEVVVRRGLTHYITNAYYNVYTSDSPSPFSPGYAVPGNPTQPPVIPRMIFNKSALNTNASPNGWIDATVNETLGNNVDAHRDWNDDNMPDLPRPQGMPYHTFDFPIDLTMDCTNYSTGAVVNLFYWNNFMHDKLWELGFKEAAGNFQTLNFGRGGLGGDAVQADAQDGAGAKDVFHVNNANMAAPPDGIPPRMQMYAATGPNPDRDGDLDAEVMCHEYTHGLSQRLVGGGIGFFRLQPSGMGEGWSDFYALALLSDPADAIDGNYAAAAYFGLDFGSFNANTTFRDNYYFGIRRYPYTTNLLKNPLTLKDIDPTQASPHAGIPISPISGGTPAEEVHAQGEVWCEILWEVRANLLGKYPGTNGNLIALQLVTDGMKLSPPEPTFVQARDAILQADKVNNGNANYNELWRAFAKRGIGASATCPPSDTTTGVQEAYDFPGLSILSVAINDTASGNGNGVIDVNECLQLFVTVRNNSLTNATSITGVITSSTPNVLVVQDTASYPDLPPNGTGRNLTPFRILTTPSFVCGTPIDLAFKVTDFAPAPVLQTATNSFRVRSGFVGLNPTYVSSAVPLAIPDGNTNGVDSILNVSGMSGAIGKVAVSVYITHTYDADLKLELVGPDGTIVKLADAGGGSGDNYGSACTPLSARATFDDNAPSSFSAATAPFVGTFRPAEPLDVFFGKSGSAVNGAWRLRVSDSAVPDAGVLQCWTLVFYPTVCSDAGGGCLPELSLSAAAAPSPALVGQNLTYTLTVLNTRNTAATGVTLTNVLPANVSLGSAVPSQGACTVANGTVRCNFGTIASGSSATASIVVQPAAAGTLTNVFSIGSSAIDANPANDVVTVISTVIEPAPVIVAAGAQLTAESYVPATGGIEPGETVAVNLTLRNTGSAATANLVATLVAGNGVSAPSGAQTYGAIVPGSAGTRAFTFTASGAAGSSVNAVLQLQDGARNLGTVTFQFSVGGELTFANGAPIVINELGPASPYPSTIGVSGVGGLVTKVTVTFTKLTHSFPDDIDALLLGPRGQKIILMADCGGGTSITNKTLTFDSSAAGFLPDEAPISAGKYLPTDYNSGTEPGGDLFPSPAPAGPLSASLDAFNGTNPNGTWSLFINDDGGGDGGLVSGGWVLTLTTVAPVNAVADLDLRTSLGSPVPALAGEFVPLILSVTNHGPANVATLVLTDILPPGLVNLEVFPSQGTLSRAGNVLTINFGAVPSGGNPLVLLRLTPGSEGIGTNVAFVSAPDSPDLDLSNNSVTNVFVIGNPVADLAVKVAASAEPVFVSGNITFVVGVSNLGPNHADFVRLTSRLAPGLAFVSATNSAGACSFSAGVVTCDIGRMEANTGAAIAIVATALNAGTVNNLFAVNGIFPEALLANNSTNVVTTITVPAPAIVPAGAAIISESDVPPNNSLDSGEAVTINFGLRNVGSADAGNLVATLQAGGGIASPSAPQSFGPMPVNGSTVSRSFNFLVTGAPGTAVTATFQLQDGALNLGTVAFNFTVSGTAAGANGNTIVIPNQGQAGTYPSTITISGVTGAVSKVTVTIRQLTHSFPEDIDMLLVGPAGQKVLLMSDAGAGNALNSVTLTFDDAGAPLPFASAIPSGTYHPADYPPADTFPAPAPAGPYATNLSAFIGSSPNGTWSLFVLDDATGDDGRIAGGWTLNFQTASPVTAPADVAVLIGAPPTIDVGAAFSYTVTVTNNGPGVATGVVLTDTLPGTFVLGSVTTSQGFTSTSAGSVTANLGTVNVGSGATVTIGGVSSGLTSLTNLAVLSASQSDLNLANNAASFVTTIGPTSVQIQRAGLNAIITWTSPGYTLESSANAEGPFGAAGLPVTTIGGTNQVMVPALDTRFYRLRKP